VKQLIVHHNAGEDDDDVTLILARVSSRDKAVIIRGLEGLPFISSVNERKS
jgi:hypothetical protein